MQIVIEIDEHLYNNAVNDLLCGNELLVFAIKNGTPLPEHHGDLIDRNELLKQPLNDVNYPSNYVRIASAIIPSTEEGDG